jgi:DNA-binding response OmpR family regulator
LPGADDARVLGDDGPDVLALTRKALSLELEASEPAPSPVPKGGDVPRGEEAEEGTAGYNLATTLLPDLVITDVMMAEMDGFELCRAIKQDPNIDHIPVIFLTARADSEDKVEGLDVGADAYLTKPFEPEELVARVENLIATRRSLRESFREERANRDTVGTGRDPDPGAENVEVAEEALPSTAEREPLKERIEETISENLIDPEFEVSDLATEVALSASQLRRRMKEMYDYTPVQLIRRRRLEAGARLLRDRPDATIGEVAYAVGFNSQSYFSRSFRDEFGTSPSQYRARHESMEA